MVKLNSQAKNYERVYKIVVNIAIIYLITMFYLILTQ